MADVDVSQGPVRLVYPAPRAGGYAENLPGGMFAVDGLTGVITPDGVFPVPGGQRALAVALAEDARIAVAGGTDDTAYVSGPRGSGGWTPQGPVYGSRAVLFDINDDLVRVVTADDPYAPQGYKFCDYATGRLYGGEETYFDPSLRICEWIRRGDITVGIAVTDQLIAHDGATGTTYLVEPGVWRHTKFRRQGDTLAMAGVRFDTAQTVLLWLTVDQLHTLPVFREDVTHTDSPHTDSPSHTDSHDDIPHDDGGPVSIPNHQQTVNAINSQYPSYLQTNSEESCGEFTERVVLQLAQDFPSEGWGHVRKVGGQTQYRGHAVDAIMSKLDVSLAIDIIAGAHNPPNRGHPAWMEVSSGGQPWMSPIPVAGGGHTDAPHDDMAHTDSPPPVNSDVEARLSALEQNAVQYGQRIGLRMAEGQALCANEGGGTESYQPVTFESRERVGPHESYTVERGE